MTTLILIRHGESEANRNNVFAGHINPDLQNKGLKQAERTAKYITENYKVDKIENGKALVYKGYSIKNEDENYSSICWS